MYASLPEVDCTHVGELLVGQHLVEHHERVLGREEPPQVLVLPPPPLFVADFLYCNKTRTRQRSAPWALATRDSPTSLQLVLHPRRARGALGVRLVLFLQVDVLILQHSR